MKVLFYVLATVAGLLGLLALLRTFEHLLVGDGIYTTQLVVGIVGILLAVIWIKRARSAS